MKYKITGTIGGIEVDLLAEPVELDEHKEDDVVFSFNDEFHVATNESPVNRIETTPTPGKYTGIEASFEFYYNGKNPSNERGRHNIVWFARNGNRDLFLYLMSINNLARFSHGIDLDHGEKHRINRLFIPDVGWHKVHFAYKWKTVSVIIEDPRESVVFDDEADIIDIEVGEKDRFYWDFGFTGEEESEPISLGWRWRNLQVKFLR